MSQPPLNAQAIDALWNAPIAQSDANRKALLAALCQSAFEQPVDVPVRLHFPYATGMVSDPLLGEKEEVLYMRLKYQRPTNTFLPKWERQEVETIKGKNGSTSTVTWKPMTGLPYLWHTRTILLVDIKDGVVQLDNPEVPAKVEDEFEGITDDMRRVPLRLAPDADHKLLSLLGFHCSAENLTKWREIVKALRGTNAKLQRRYGTARKGWVRFPGYETPHYIYGNRVIAPAGYPDLRAVARNSSTEAAADGIATHGSFEGWRQVMALALRNPDFAVLCGFAASAPLLSRVWGMEPGIVHLVGKSGSGKSTAQKGVAALIGSSEAPSEATSYIQAWRVTENAIEAPLEARSDAPSIYDELHSLPAKTDLLSLLYAVANGRGKGRMTKDIEARIVKVWKTQIISSGEKSFADRLRQDGAEDMPGGLKFRVVDVHIGATPFWSDVEGQTADGKHGVYEPLVAKSKSSAATAQARVIEAIEQGFLEHYGHFWERWILKLQTTEGLAYARKCWDNERANLVIPQGASSIYARRSKHVAASITGLLGILDICKFDSATHDLILARARKWAVEHLWSSGLENIYSSEEGDIYEKFATWLMGNEQLLHNVNDPMAIPKANLGWIDKQGSAAITVQGLKEICARHLKMDLGRLQQALEKNGWESARKRHPRAGEGSATHPLTVWFKKNVFYEPGAQ